MCWEQGTGIASGSQELPLNHSPGRRAMVLQGARTMLNHGPGLSISLLKIHPPPASRGGSWCQARATHPSPAHRLGQAHTGTGHSPSTTLGG